MSSLTDLPELVGFFSYSREDDADSHGALSSLRNRIQGELRGQLGRTAKAFRLWQDKEAIASGTLWESEIKNAVAQSIFFIPIITPTVVASPYCRFELEAFLARESELGRNDLVFPILYIDVPGLEDSTRRQNDPVLSLIAKRQYMDWRSLRHQDARSTDVSVAIERFCKHIRDALYKPWLSPHERKEQEEAEAQRHAETERRRQEAEIEARAKEAEARQRAEAAVASKRDAKQKRGLLAQERNVSSKKEQVGVADEYAGSWHRKLLGDTGWLKGSLKRKYVLMGLGVAIVASASAAFAVYSGAFQSIANTTWDVSSQGSETCDYPRKFQFKYFHELWIPRQDRRAGTWHQSGSSISFDVSDYCNTFSPGSVGWMTGRNHRYIGIFQGDKMSGQASNLDTGRTWKWSATRTP
jgi:hypothetical protein